MRHPHLAGFLACLCIVTLASCTTSSPTGSSPNPVLTQAGANIDHPFQAHIAGAVCLADGAASSPGLVRLGFPDLNRPSLIFALGPSPAVANQSRSPAYSGPGQYPHIAVTGDAPTSHHFTGLATIVVNADDQSGTFALDDGSATGTWRCSHPIPIVQK